MRIERTAGPGMWLTVAEAARIAGVHRYTVYDWFGRGRLQPLRCDDGTYRIAVADLDRYLATRRAAAAAGVRLHTLLRWTDEADAAAD
ncbi:MAG: Helix-turn-helix domain [Thermomicrobiales bacterium]|jgi:excisionase family DNA binding protein|nr:Helix-turn-helix domain [Thermomicrobiales bacterium]MEA2528168.1 Helix-turn-helix domain [Thermomicrobiales bacterium]MEA2528558.1 Helix-turn-helix domain [Thermomicrobiales bacterium]MEA2586797.1 Helix-turn-helix domain [Thermomicrobiales bacterium]MEA2598102.1 Helix-turn-helix domain [Thermomicrobiales bacterium]